MEKKSWLKRILITPADRNYLAILGFILVILSGGYCFYTSIQSYKEDAERANSMLQGKNDIGIDRLEVPITRQASFPRIAIQQRSMAEATDQALAGLKLSELPVKGDQMNIQFAGIYLPSNSDLINYILIRVKQELQKAGASHVEISYPTTTYQLEEGMSTPNGWVTELSELQLVSRDAQIKNPPPGANRKDLLLVIREAGVDTNDRSSYSSGFYIRTCLFSAIIFFITSTVIYLLISRILAGPQWRNSSISTAAGILAGWSALIMTFIAVKPDQPYFNMISRVNLISFANLDNGQIEASGTGVSEVLLDSSSLDSPKLLSQPLVMAPAEGGVYQIMPKTIVRP